MKAKHYLRALIIMLLFFASNVHAQEVIIGFSDIFVFDTRIESLGGTITDASDGTGIQGALITLTGTSNNYTAISQADGSYLIGDLPASFYNMTVTSAGFQTHSDNVLVSGDPDQVIDVVLVPSDSDMLMINSSLTAYADIITEHSSNLFQLSGNVNINNILFFDGDITIDKRQTLVEPEISGNCSFYTTYIGSHPVYWIKQNNKDFRYLAIENSLRPRSSNYLTDGLFSIGGFPITIGKLIIDTDGDFVDVKSIAQMPFPVNKILEDLVDKFGLPFAIQSMSGSKILSRQNGEQTAVNISGVSVNLTAFKIENFSLNFDSNTQTYGGGFMLKIPGISKSKRMDADSLEYWDEMSSAIFEFRDENNETIDGLSLFDLLEMRNNKSFNLVKFGASIEFIQGDINKITVSIGAKVPIGPTGLFITKLTGGMTDMAKESPKITAGVDIELFPKVPVFGSPVKLNDFTVDIQPWNEFSGDGEFQVFGQTVSKGRVEYDHPKRSLNAKGLLTLAPNFEVLQGRFDLNLSGSGINGSGIMTIRTPGNLPKGFGWASNRRLGQREVYFSNELIQYQTSGFSIPLALEVKFGKAGVPGFHFSIGRNLNNLRQIWKGHVDHKRAITFQVSENIQQLLVVSKDTISINEPFDFMLQNPNGQIFDQVNAYYYEKDDASQSTIMSLLQPIEGDWLFLTAYEGDVALFVSGQDQIPATMVEQPDSRRTRNNEISITINDFSDTLKVQVFYNTHNRRFDGRLIDEFIVINNAELNFTWQNQDVSNGEYFIYTRIDDGKNSPVLQYAPGSIWVENDPEIETPVNLGAVQYGDSVIVTWNEAQMANTVAANVYYKDLSTWRIRQKAVIGDNQTVLYDMAPGRGYKIWCKFINDNGTYSPKSNTRELVFTSDTRNNPPYFTMDPDSIFIFIAGEMAQYTLQANDADGDALTFSLIGDTLGIDVIGDKLQWTPALQQRGVYYQGIIVSDGAETDTTYQQLVVYTPEQVEIRLAYNSVQLYEADNTFLILRNFFSQEPTETVMLTNLRTGEKAIVTCRRVNEFEYMVQFQLSFEKRSEISVEDGDTIKATYTYDGNTYEALAFYNINQQTSDIIPPGDITDLSIEPLGDNKIVLYWTASGDDGYQGKAFRYDIRYAYEPIESEGAYFSAYLLQNAPYPSVSGEQDSLVVNLQDLQFIEQHEEVWFSIKAEDAAKNRSGLSNSPSAETLLQPTNVTASVQDVYNIHLNWQGPQPGDKDGNAFESYTIFRQFNEGSYSVTASEVESLSYIDDLKVRPDGIYRYGILSVYEDGESEITYSEPVSLQRFVNLNILCNIHGQQNHEGIQFEMIAHDEIYGQEFSRTTNATGLIMLANVFMSDYTIEISKEGYATQVEEISVTNSQEGFSFKLFCEPLPPTELVTDDITAFSAVISWTALSIESQWDMLYGLEGFAPDSEGTLLENITSKPFMLSGLSPKTTYDVYMRAVCGENVSEWSAPITFITGEQDIPNDLSLSGVISDGETECFDALQTITLTDFTIESGGSATLIAGQSILMLPGTTVHQGGDLLARITEHQDDYCGHPLAVEVAEQPVTSKDDLVLDESLYEIRENGFFKLYPNPTDDTFNLELTAAELEQTITVEAYSMLGWQLFTIEMPPNRIHTLSLGRQQPGMYIIRVIYGDQIGVERLIKR